MFSIQGKTFIHTRTLRKIAQPNKQKINMQSKINRKEVWPVSTLKKKNPHPPSLDGRVRSVRSTATRRSQCK